MTNHGRGSYFGNLPLLAATECRLRQTSTELVALTGTLHLRQYLVITMTTADTTSHHPTEPSYRESMVYYAGLPSRPRLIARSSALTNPWSPPTGPEAYTVRRELMVVGDHALSNGVWEDRLAPHFLAILDHEQVLWTSVDVVRIRNADRANVVEEGFFDPHVIIWIGIMPQSLTSADGYNVAIKCKKFLEQEGINDVHVELRESTVNYSAGPKFLKPTSSDAAADVCMPLTSTLGLSTCGESTPWIEGTGGFFMAEGGDSKRIFLVTTRHVVLPPDIVDNDMIDEDTISSQPRRNVLLLGDSAFKRLHASIQEGIHFTSMDIQYEQRRTNGNDEDFDKAHGREDELHDAQKALKVHNTLDKDVLPHWSTHNNRVLGHIIFSPPISMGVSNGRYTEDFAIIEMDTSKFDTENFVGNAIDFGEKRFEKFHRMNVEFPPNEKSFFYPFERLLYLEGTVSLQQMRRPTLLDRNGDPSTAVLKRGTATGLTFGYANNIPSFTRRYFNNKQSETSMEWPVLPKVSDCGTPFSSEGDSGAIIVNGHGQMISLLTSGAGTAESPDITYGTHIEYLLESITKRFPHAHLYPVLT